jgi:hypothetical protein
LEGFQTRREAWAVVFTARAEVLINPRQFNARLEQRVALEVQHLAAVAFGYAHITDQHHPLTDTARKAKTALAIAR